MGSKEHWRNLTDSELNAELKRLEVEYRNFIDEQQRRVNLRAAIISDMKMELFKRKVTSQNTTPR